MATHARSPRGSALTQEVARAKRPSATRMSRPPSIGRDASLNRFDRSQSGPLGAGRGTLRVPRPLASTRNVGTCRRGAGRRPRAAPSSPRPLFHNPAVGHAKQDNQAKCGSGTTKSPRTWALCERVRPFGVGPRAEGQRIVTRRGGRSVARRGDGRRHLGKLRTPHGAASLVPFKGGAGAGSAWSSS